MHFNLATRLLLATSVGLASLLAAAGPAHGAAGFGDVAGNQFYTEPVQWMVDNGITTGSSPGCFSPDRAVTRAELATLLHRLAGEPEGGSEPFADVPSGAYYQDAVAWMVSEGITTGTSPTTFHPDRPVTRGEIAAFMHRYSGSPEPAVDYAQRSKFVDTPIGTFFARPVQWMVGAEITTGTSPTTFEPYRAVTRAEAAAFMYRMAGSPPVAVRDGGTCGPVVRDDIAAAEAHSLELLNSLRVSVGVAPLTIDPTMSEYARDWSRTMSQGGFFAHSGGPYGENIVWWSDENLSPTEAAERFHQMWVDSAGHYQNMTLAGYTKVGVGLWHDENGWHGTHVFAY